MIKAKKKSAYEIVSIIILAILALLFIFPIYWIITGSLKTAQQINAVTPEWFPMSATLDNYVRLFQQPALL